MTTTFPPPLVPPGTDVPPADPGPQDDPAPPDVPDAGADDLGGLRLDGMTIGEVATVERCKLEIWGVCVAAAARTLAAEHGALADEVTQAELRLSEALRDAQGPCDAVGSLESELAACEARASELAAAADGDLDVRISARTWRLAVEQEITALQGRLQQANRDADPYRNHVLTCQHDAQLARQALRSLDAAITSPFGHPRGMVLPIYEDYLLLTGKWIDESRHSQPARRLVDGWLRSTGLRAEHDREAINRYIAGDREALKLGDTKQVDGGALIRSPDGPPVFVHGRATADQLASVGPVPPSGPSGADVSGGLRTAAGQMPAPANVTKAARGTVDADWPLPGAITRAWR